MDAKSLSQIMNQINHHINSLESLEHCLQQAESLVHIATTTEFATSPKRIVHHYLCTLSNTIEQAQKLNEELCRGIDQLKMSFYQEHNAYHL